MYIYHIYIYIYVYVHIYTDNTYDYVSKNTPHSAQIERCTQHKREAQHNQTTRSAREATIHTYIRKYITHIITSLTTLTHLTQRDRCQHKCESTPNQVHSVL